MNSSDDTSLTRQQAHDAVEFLAGSWHRLDVLEAVVDAPRTRNELKERTEVSRVTLSRILSDLEERGWLVRDGKRFEATAHGEVVAAEVGRLLANLEAAADLGDAIEWLPNEEFGFDLTRLRNARIIAPGREDLTAPTRKLVELAEQCRRIRAVPTGITHEFIAALRDGTVDDDLRVEFVLPPAVHDIVSEDADLRRQFREMVDSGNARVYRYLGDATLFMVGIFDGRVMVCGHGEGDVPPGTLETSDDAIRRWAEAYFDARRSEARRLEPGTFTP